MNDLDLRNINLSDKNILTFQTKKAAQNAKLPYLAYITPAANRFWSFWVIVRQEQNGVFSILTKSGEFLPIENRRWVSSKFEQGRADRIAGDPCRSANGAYLDGWYSVPNPK